MPPVESGLKPPVYVDTDRALAQLAQRLLAQPAIAVDTEANPLFAYRERLCLVQISTRTRDYIVDPLADIDLAPLAPVLADPMITKVLHDAEFDLMTLRRAHAFEVVGLFDTKVAAASLGMKNVGLAALLEEHFGVRMDKRFQRSDWGARPLSEGQVHYARLDTHYLLALADELRPRLHAAGAPAVLEVAAELRRLISAVPEERPFRADDFARIRGADALDGTGRRALRELFVMRDKLAEARNCPPFKVLTNEMLIRLAEQRPAGEDELQQMGRAVPAKLARRYGERIVATLQRAARMKPIASLPRQPAEGVDALDRGQRETYERLRRWRKGVARARATDPSLVLPRPMMLALTRLRPAPKTAEHLRRSGVIEPWRIEFYGEQLLAVLAGG